MAKEKRLIDANSVAQSLLDAEKIIRSESSEDYDRGWMDALSSVADLIMRVPTPNVDAVEVEDPELLKAIKMLIEQYAHSKASEYVHSPVAHALFHTWRQVDKRR